MNKLFFENSFMCRFTRHFIFFAATVILFTVILFVQKGTGSFFHTFFVTLLNSFFFFGYAYITIFLLIPEFLLKKNVIWFILLFLLVGVGLSALKLVASNQIFYASIAPGNIENTGMMNLRFIVVNTKDMTFIVALFCIGKYLKDYLYTEALHKKLEVQNKEAQSKLLQSQFDPHFLFNTINNMYALSLMDREKTREVISRIKTVLQFIIEESQKGFIGLNDEIRLVENYIQLEKLRYGKRLKVDFEVNGSVAAVKVPPMLLFLLVENAFKHGASLDAGTPWIKINTKVDSGEVIISVKNSKPKTHYQPAIEEKEGHGLKNLRRRLEIIYSKQNCRLMIENKDTEFKVELMLKEKEVEIGRKRYK